MTGDSNCLICLTLENTPKIQDVSPFGLYTNIGILDKYHVSNVPGTNSTIIPSLETKTFYFNIILETPIYLFTGSLAVEVEH